MRDRSAPLCCPGVDGVVLLEAGHEAETGSEAAVGGRSGGRPDGRGDEVEVELLGLELGDEVESEVLEQVDDGGCRDSGRLEDEEEGVGAGADGAHVDLEVVDVWVLWVAEDDGRFRGRLEAQDGPAVAATPPTERRSIDTGRSRVCGEGARVWTPRVA